MVVCIDPVLGFFFRINSKPWQIAVKLEKSTHPFLKWDSFLECGEPYDLDEFLVDEALRVSGVIGRIDANKIPEICKAVQTSKTCTAKEIQSIEAALNC